ncbi:type VI secretion system Vgr family protein [Rahnella victoriana]|uniref:type VI secretion system Vgr family protein n=1 Tax=Rahnella victoriana TaxID=1510570 RepID=UPI001038F69C|nr:type VI secretion system Vgr family protein [Rahnella victoriana]TBX35948.1 type VI secretion system tip protein VgrG [Rahnella victoriana]
MTGHVISLAETIFNPVNSQNRYLLHLFNSDVVADVESFTGHEALSEPYFYVIRFTSHQKDIPATSLLKQYASFEMRVPNPAWSLYLPGSEYWKKNWQVEGVISVFERLSTSADESLYEITLSHPMALMNNKRRSAIYQDISVPELVKQILKEHHFEGYEINFDGLAWIYPRREMIVQWGETDLQFIRRLLSEVGIWFRFEKHPKHDEIVTMVFADSQSLYLFNHAIRLYNEAGMSGNDYTIRELKARHNVVPASVMAKNYYYPLRNYDITTETIDVTRGDDKTQGTQYIYADIHQAPGERYAHGRGQPAETSVFYARIRHELLLNEQHRLTGVTDSPQILPGTELIIDGNLSDAFKNSFVVTAMKATGSRKNAYRSELSGIPYSEDVCFRPERLPRPCISGTVPARISALKFNDTLAHIDAFGRYRVKFHFDLEDQWKKGYESLPVRLARPYAGDTYGFHFPLQDNTEVAIAFEGGDPERPYIAHALHDATNPDVVTNRNNTRNVIRTQRNNKLRMEDKRDQEHIKLATEYGKSQVNLGHLVDASGEPRGEGFEIRTDKHGALRAGQGLHITTEGQPKASGHQSDMAATVAQLQAALQLAQSLSASTTASDTPATDTGKQQALRQATDKLAEPVIALYADAGIAQTTPKTAQISAGQNVITTSHKDTSLNAFGRFTVAAAELFSVFVRKAGIFLTAAGGPLHLKAQKDEIKLTAFGDVITTSSNGRISFNAKNEIVLMSGGAGIRIKNGVVEVLAPQGILYKTMDVRYLPAASIQEALPVFKNGELSQQFLLHADGEPDHPLTNQKFMLIKNGVQIEGITDADGHSPLLNPSELESYSLRLIHDEQE